MVLLLALFFVYCAWQLINCLYLLPCEENGTDNILPRAYRLQNIHQTKKMECFILLLLDVNMKSSSKTIAHEDV